MRETRECISAEIMGAKAIPCNDTDDQPVLDLIIWRQRMINLLEVKVQHRTDSSRATYELLDQDCKWMKDNFGDFYLKI